ncbi:MAG: hypothetical protein HN348_29080, partial [Proteobacteria bacterium]|nr:hypothetical protein [Pseudomonadota bacterium]
MSFLLAGICPFAADAAKEDSFEDQPNLILISLDTTRADALSCYGERIPGLEADPGVVTPNLDAI